MIMRAKNDGEVLIVELEGQLDFETTLQFKETCAHLIKKHPNDRVVFNLERLKFVGSSGINQFIQVLKHFHTKGPRPKFCRLSSEFQRVFKAYQTSRNPFEIFEDEAQAMLSFTQPPAPKKVSKKVKPV